MKLEIIIIILLSYLLGAIPFGKLVVKIFANVDITKEGTGNVGTMNAYDVTGKRFIGFIVFFLDALKGYLAVLITSLVFQNDFYLISLSAVWVLLGHNFNLFLRFKGGRGLASSVGIFFFINPIAVIFWILMWLTGYFAIRKNVHIANTIATIGAMILIFSAPKEFIEIFNLINISNLFEYKILTAILCLIILFRHIKPLKELLNK